MVELGFRADDEVVDSFLEFIQSDSIQYEQTDLDESYSWISNEITNNIISRKFGVEEGYKVIIKEDSQLQEALSLFEKFSSLQDTVLKTTVYPQMGCPLDEISSNCIRPVVCMV